MSTFADKAIAFYSSLNYTGHLPHGVSVMNPFISNNEILSVIRAFYMKYYSDNNIRKIIIGINPGRFGAGVTGIPFTDTIRLKEKCGIHISGIKTFETSSVFIYEMIERYGGPYKFYRDYYISSVSPLGFIKTGPGEKEVNFNYYDSRELTEAITEFAVDSIKKQLEFGIGREKCFCLGTGRNFIYLSKINNKYNFFENIEPLEHPRYIMQYKSGKREHYLDIYLKKLTGN